MKNNKAILMRAAIILASVLCGLFIGGLSFIFINRIGPIVEYWIPRGEQDANFIKAWMLIFILTPSVFLMSIWIGAVSNTKERWLAMIASLFCGPIIARSCEYIIQPMIGDQTENLFDVIGLSYMANIAVTILCLAYAQKYTKEAKPSPAKKSQPNNTKRKPYLLLLHKFTQGSMSAVEFESSYLTLFKNDETQWNDEEFLILNDLFAAVDSFNADETLRDDNDLDEAQLLDAAQSAYEALRRLK